MPLNIQPWNPLDLPVGTERADGEGGRLGTATPTGAVKVQTALGQSIAYLPTEESPDSPTIERAEQKTVTHTYTMSWEAAKTQQEAMPRGTVFYEDDPDGDTEGAPMFKVLSTRIRHKPGETAELEVTSEQLNGDVPPDEFQVVPEAINFNILKYPRYYRALAGGDSDEAILNTMVIRELQNYMDNPSYAARNAIAYRLFQSIGHPGSVAGGVPVCDDSFTDPYGGTGIVTPITGTDFAKYAALEVVSKFWLGIENPYIVGWKVTYSQYFWRPQFLHPGGVVQAPWDAGDDTVDEQFLIAPDRAYADGIVTVPDDTIFGQLHLKNPTAYLPLAYSYDSEANATTAISWLRQADQQYYQRTFYRVDKTWIGAPVGAWDADMFSGDVLDVPLADVDGEGLPLIPNFGYSGVPVAWIPKPPPVPANPAPPA